MAVDDVRHPDAERLAEYADGVLDVEARTDVERHLADCADCRAVVMETMALLEAAPVAADRARAAQVVPFRSRRLITIAAGLAMAAALVLAIRVARPEWVGGLFGPRGDRPELQELIAAVAAEPTRPVEGRLSGGFKYGPPPSPTRGPGSHEVSPEVKIAAARIEQAAGDAGTSDAQAALGIAALALGDLDKAIDALERAVAQRPSEARYQSDLAAAYLARAKRRNAEHDWARAKAAADRALREDPDLIEAWFNRALAIEALEPPEAARRAWQAYLSRDSSSGWAREHAPGAARP